MIDLQSKRLRFIIVFLPVPKHFQAVVCAVRFSVVAVPVLDLTVNIDNSTLASLAELTDACQNFQPVNQKHKIFNLSIKITKFPRCQSIIRNFQHVNQNKCS